MKEALVIEDYPASFKQRLYIKIAILKGYLPEMDHKAWVKMRYEAAKELLESLSVEEKSVIGLEE